MEGALVGEERLNEEKHHTGCNQEVDWLAGISPMAHMRCTSALADWQQIFSRFLAGREMGTESKREGAAAAAAAVGGMTGARGSSESCMLLQGIARPVCFSNAATGKGTREPMGQRFSVQVHTHAKGLVVLWGVLVPYWIRPEVHQKDPEESCLANGIQRRQSPPGLPGLSTLRHTVAY